MTIEQAIATFILMLVAQIPILVTSLAGWLRSKENTQAIKDNTALTEKGASAAVSGAAEAKSAATEMKEVVLNKLNGGLTHAVEAMFAPLRDAVNAHAEQDERNLTEVKGTLDILASKYAIMEQMIARVDKLEAYNHNSAHRVIDAVNAVHLKVTEMSAKADAKGNPDRSEP